MLAKNCRLPAAFFKNGWLDWSQKKENIFFVVRRYPSAGARTRFAVVVAKKIAPRAVDRVRIRRLLYEYIRVSQAWKRPGGDVVVVVKAPLVGDARHVRLALERSGGDILSITQ
jgi:ribonuclease P protein component